MNKNNRFYKKLTALVATGLLTAAVSGTAFAADTVQLDLHDSVQMALENNRTIRQALTDVDTAKWTLSKARRTMGPTVTWTSGANRIGGDSLDSAHNAHALGMGPAYDYSWTNTAQGVMPLYNGSVKGQIKQARYGLNAQDSRSRRRSRPSACRRRQTTTTSCSAATSSMSSRSRSTRCRSISTTSMRSTASARSRSPMCSPRRSSSPMRSRRS